MPNWGTRQGRDNCPCYEGSREDGNARNTRERDATFVQGLARLAGTSRWQRNEHSESEAASRSEDDDARRTGGDAR